MTGAATGPLAFVRDEVPRRLQCPPPPLPPGKADDPLRQEAEAFVERIERLEEEKATSDDIKDVYAEAKGSGYDIKALHRRPAAQAGHQRAARAEAVLETYMHALGMLN